MQLADWIAAIVGRVWSYKVQPDEFAEYEVYDRLFSSRLDAVATHSTLQKRSSRSSHVGTLGVKLAEAQAKQSFVVKDTE